MALNSMWATAWMKAGAAFVACRSRAAAVRAGAPARASRGGPACGSVPAAARRRRSRSSPRRERCGGSEGQREPSSSGRTRASRQAARSGVEQRRRIGRMAVRDAQRRTTPPLPLRLVRAQLLDALEVAGLDAGDVLAVEARGVELRSRVLRPGHRVLEVGEVLVDQPVAAEQLLRFPPRCGRARPVRSADGMSMP